jgi:Rrf2 family transcriptional regulator, iron-sulfur cluster assembly transcription factor
MSIIFSRQCEYALQAVSYLALTSKGAKVSIKELASKLNIPHHFLAKILQDLTYKKLLISQKGKNGGFALAQSPEKITLYDIVEAIDGNDYIKKCVMGFHECSEKHPCAVHNIWGKQREGIYSMLVSKNIAEIARGMKKPEYSM